MVIINARMHPLLVRAFVEEAARRGLTPSALMREVVEKAVRS